LAPDFSQAQPHSRSQSPREVEQWEPFCRPAVGGPWRTEIPEPSSLVLAGAGALLLWGIRRRS